MKSIEIEQDLHVVELQNCQKLFKPFLNEKRSFQF